MTISSVAPAAVPATGAAAVEPGGLGGLFAGFLGTPAPGGPELTTDPEASVPETPSPEDALVGQSAVEILGAAQIMAAAQVVPVTPVLAAALAASGATAGTPGVASDGTAVAPLADGGVGVHGAVDVPGVGLPGVGVPVTTEEPAGPPAGAPTGSTAVSAGDPVLHAVPPSAVPLAAPAATEQTTSAAQQVAAASATSGTSSAEAGAAQHHDARPDQGGRQPTERGAEPVTAVTGPQAGAQAAGTTQTAPSTPAGRPEAAHVTGQVFPEIGRLVSRGDGTQRITLKLAPEALGEVRVVLTVRDGDVQVRMIGSEQAQQALRAGAPELQRLLDLAGASSSQIIVGDQGSSPDAGLNSGNDRDQEDHRTAGTRDGDTTARDGSTRGPQSRPSSDPTATRGGTSTVTRTHPGVDVTM